jgi:uncharacterized membrane protein
MTVAGRADPVSRHLRVGLRKAITTLHVIAAVALLGSQSALLVLALSAALTSDASLRHAGYQLMRTLVFALEIPLAVTALTSGLVLAVRTKWGVFQHYWIIGKLSLLLVTALIGIIAIRPWTEQMLTATEPQAAAQLPASRWLLAVALALAITVLATATGLSVYKPRGRTRRDAAPAR